MHIHNNDLIRRKARITVTWLWNCCRTLELDEEEEANGVMIVVELSSMVTGKCCTTGDEKSNLDCLLVPEEAMGVVMFTEW